MLVVHHIQSLERPELEPYRTMRRAAEHQRRGIFVAEGEKVVRRLLHTPLSVISLLVTPEWLQELKPTLENRPEEIHAYVAEKKLLETMVGFQLYHGLLALARIPEAATLEHLLRATPHPRLLVGVDGLSSSENLGVMVRNCAAFNVQALLVGETCASPWLRRAVRNSMGGIFHLPIIPSNNLADDLRRLRDCGFSTVAAHPASGSKALIQADLTRDCCLVFGSEGHGISEAVLAACSVHLAVPMPAHVDSLNVSSATAVFLYEAARQRGRT
jgi:tRNA G18 (ribose-2'-O)-methylase SpoU